MPQRDHTRLSGYQYALLETLLEKLLVVLAKITEHPEIRTVPMGYVHKSKVFPTLLLYLSGTEYPLTICIDQYPCYQPWMIGVLSTNTVVLLDLGRFQLLEYLLIDETVMIFGQ
jgi:hypothetical protein